MLRVNENVQKINEARQAEQQQVPMSEPVEGDEGPQVAGEATSAMHDVANLQHSDNSGPSLDELASSLNADQTRVLSQPPVAGCSPLVLNRELQQSVDGDTTDIECCKSSGCSNSTQE